MIFTIVTLSMSGIDIYLNQTDSYKKQCEENITNIAKYLEALIMADGDDFADFQKYFLEHHDEIDIPTDFPSYLPAMDEYDSLFAKEYPGKTLGVDIKFNELSDKVKKAFATYTYEYWLTTFEKARDSFGIMYTYYLAPTGEDNHMYWMIDAIRDSREVDGKSYLNLCIDVEEPLEEHQKMWEAWNTGEKPTGYDVYDNEYGQTYAYYVPLVINGIKLGVIGTEVAIDAVNREILRNTITQVVSMGIILIACVAVVLIVIYKRYISKLLHLQASVREYANGKDPTIAGEIEKDAVGKDEIAALSMQVAAMILELENYMKRLIQTAQELVSTRQHADELNELAQKDALTGVRNKTAYDKEVKHLEWKIAEGYKDFAIAMIDLNFLKRINDTFGHEQGNLAIKKLCSMVCSTFKHSPVFRIGGDEFVVVLENEDYENADALIKKFNDWLDQIAAEKDLEVWELVSASVGLARYDPERDTSVANVFKRADKAMYTRKKEMKAVRTD